MNPSDEDLATILSRPGYRISRDSAPQKPRNPEPADCPSTVIPSPEASRAAKARTRKLAQAMSENDLQACVIDVAHHYGYKVAHFRSVRVKKKDGSTFWQTPVAADGTGWPDLVLVRAAREGMGRVIFAELKTERGTVEPAQRDWLALLTLTQRVEVHCWRPTDWLNGTIERILV